MENSYYRKTSRFLKKITLSVCFFISWALYCEEVEINYCFKKVHSLDPGTLHFFLNNNSKNEIKVEKLYFNDIEIEEGQETDDIFWWTQVPNVALPGQVSNIMIKIKKILSLPVKIKLKLNTGQFLEKHIDSLVPEFFRISSISFDITENKVYIYLENNFPNKTIEISDIFVNKKSILNSVKKLSKFILPGEKICIVYSSFEKINPNQYIPIKVITQDGMITGALPRVYNYFPIQSFGEDKRKEMFFNEDNFDIHFPTDIKKFENYKCEPLYKVYHLFDDPVCTDEKRGFLGATAKEVIKRRKICWEKDPFHPTFIYICEYCKPRGYFIYSELADIIGVDPYELVYYNNPPEQDGYYVELGKKSAAPRPIVAIPEAFKYITKKFPLGCKRFPTPEEERILVYSEIAAGAKGLWYFTSSGEIGYKNEPKLEKEISKINKEIQYLKEYLVIGEPMDISKTDSQSVKADAIFCGDKGIVIIVRNGDYRTTFDKEKNEWITNVEKPGKINIFVTLPLWVSYQIETIASIVDKDILPFKKDYRRIIIEKEMVEIAEPILIKFKKEI